LTVEDTNKQFIAQYMVVIYKTSIQSTLSWIIYRI